MVPSAGRPQCCNSGFSELVKLMHEHPNLIKQLVGTDAKSQHQPYSSLKTLAKEGL